MDNASAGLLRSHGDVDLPHPALPFALPGFETTELDSWPQAGEEWRRMRVVWPSCVATHSTEQTRYVGGDRLLRRHDYDVKIMGGSGAAHPLVVSIDLGEIAFT